MELRFIEEGVLTFGVGRGQLVKSSFSELQNYGYLNDSTKNLEEWITTLAKESFFSGIKYDGEEVHGSEEEFNRNLILKYSSIIDNIISCKKIL